EAGGKKPAARSRRQEAVTIPRAGLERSRGSRGSLETPNSFRFWTSQNLSGLPRTFLDFPRPARGSLPREIVCRFTAKRFSSSEGRAVALQPQNFYPLAAPGSLSTTLSR